MASPSPAIVDLRELAAAPDPSFGGKAAGLARLIATGARVPEGFACRATLAEPSEWAEGHREQVRARASRLLERGPLAVRSSAIDEDSASRSFAGVFETVLGVRDADGVFVAAARCIASGAGPRSVAYSGGAAAVPVGVVVQTHVDARAAGVCFTRDPTGRDGAIVIEAVAGSGDPLVSGRAQPERWRVYRSGSGVWEARREGAVAVLAPGQAVAIARGAERIAQAFGRPLDLEWALADGNEPWWLQARPITAAAALPSYDVLRFSEPVDDGPVTVWSNWNVREVIPEPLLPLEWSLWRDVVLPTALEPLVGRKRSSPLFRHLVAVDLVEGRIYWNMNGLLALPLAGRLLPRWLPVIDARAGEVLGRLLASGVLQPRRLPIRTAALRMRALLASARSAVGLIGAMRPEHAVRTMAECARTMAARGDVAGFSDAALVEELKLLGRPEAAGLRAGHQVMIVGFAVYAAAHRAFASHPNALRLLTAGIRGNPTTEISIAVDALAAAAKPCADVFAEPLPTTVLLARLEAHPAGAVWCAALRRFQALYGQRCPGEFHLTAPRWSEDPTMIVELVRAGLRSAPAEGVAARLERLGRERRVAVDEAVARSPAWRRPLLRRLASLVERYMPLREAPKHYAMYVFQRMRAAALELGSRLSSRGRLDRQDDALFLEWEELRRLLDGATWDARSLVAERRTRDARHRSLKPPHHLRSDGIPVDEPAPKREDAALLRGLGASHGRASGHARVLREPDPAAMADGDILVVAFADPGWTPLFPRAAAVVMEVGGLMCHAAVVARELGIPAVFGASDATLRIPDGAVVHVDGDRGTVSLEAGEARGASPPSGPRTKMAGLRHIDPEEIP